MLGMWLRETSVIPGDGHKAATHGGQCMFVFALFYPVILFYSGCQGANI